MGSILCCCFSQSVCLELCTKYYRPMISKWLVMCTVVFCAWSMSSLSLFLTLTWCRNQDLARYMFQHCNKLCKQHLGEFVPTLLKELLLLLFLGLLSFFSLTVLIIIVFLLCSTLFISLFFLPFVCLLGSFQMDSLGLVFTKLTQLLYAYRKFH